MGLIRLLLAIAVVIDHSGPLFGIQWVDGWLAVKAFFMISGFYMKLILTDNYPNTNAGNRLFYSNRALRIYPLYWIVLALSLIWNLVALHSPATVHSIDVITVWRQHGYLDGARSLYLVLSNVFLVGLDYGFFVDFDRGMASLTAYPWPSTLHAFAFSPVPQAWSLGIEVAVYAVAPFLFRLRPAALAAIAAACVGGRACFAAWGLDRDPWLYRFLPFELGLFCIGALLFVAMRRWRLDRFRGIGSSAVGLACMSVIFAGFLRSAPLPVVGPILRIDTFLVVMAACIPFAFARSKAWRWDRWLGELSYPTYLVHLIVIGQCYGDFGPYGLKPVVGSLVLAAILTVTLDVPLNRLRQARVRHRLGRDEPSTIGSVNTAR